MSVPGDCEEDVERQPTDGATNDNIVGGGFKRKKLTALKAIKRTLLASLFQFSILVSVWVGVCYSVPTLKRVTVLGSQLYRWSLLGCVITLGFFYVRIVLSLVFFKLNPFSRYREDNTFYYLQDMKGSLGLVSYITLVLYTWLCAIKTSHRNVQRYGTLTLVSFLVGAVLCVLKDVALLRWKSKYIYKKYKGKILAAGFHLHLLLRITGQKIKDDGLSNGAWVSNLGLHRSTTLLSWLNNGKRIREVIDLPKDDGDRRVDYMDKFMLSRHVGFQDINNLTKCLTEKYELAIDEDRDYILDIVQRLKAKIPRQNREENSIDRTILEHVLALDKQASWDRELDKSYVDVLYTLLGMEEPDRPVISYEKLEKWTLDGLKCCIWVGHRLNANIEVMGILERVLTGLIAAAVVLLWLLITGFATTQVVVGLASLFLGLTFVFGDTCKTFFQGVVFSFLTHPFDVGDQCIIDNKQLEVKKLNILTTTFSGNQKKEIVLPNAALSTKQIIKLKGEQVELDDTVELNILSSTKTSEIKALQEHIEKWLDDKITHGELKGKYGATVEQIGESIKLAIRFEHKPDSADAKDVLESLQIRKYRTRSALLLDINEFRENRSLSEEQCKETIAPEIRQAIAR